MQIDLIKELRDKTGAGVMECRKALVQANGDLNKAAQILREKGVEGALKKANREVKEGLIESYVHLGGKIGVMVEVNCETDFVARNELFKKLCRDIAMQIAAASPTYIRAEDVPKEIVEKEKEAFKETLKNKSQIDVDKFWEERLNQFNRTHCLLEQPFIRDEKQTIKDYLNSVIAQFGENIQVRRFVRYQLGE
jgi:elongation factor Ts